MPISGLLAYDQDVAGRICLIGAGDVQIKGPLLPAVSGFVLQIS
jgi:hypothetical protein